MSWNAALRSARLDCGTMNFNEADYVMVNTPGLLRDMAKRMVDSGHAD